jgi:hypothetical protein
MRQPAFPSAFAAVLAAAAAMPAAAVDVLVDFDHHSDGSPIAVAIGQVLRDAVVLPYLAEYGITIADRSRSGIEIRISRPTQAVGTSPFNVFEAWAPTLSPPSPYSYRMVFDQPVGDLSFVRAALIGLTSHDAWQVTAFDGQGIALGSVSEPQVTQFGDTPAANARAFSLPYQGIASIVVLGNLSAGGQTYESLVMDDLRFHVSAVPEPHMWALWAGGLGAIALRWRRARALARPASTSPSGEARP